MIIMFITNKHKFSPVDKESRKESTTEAKPVALKKENNNVYYFEYENTNTNYYNDNGLVIRLKASNLEDLKSIDLMYLSGAQNNVYPAKHFTLHKNNIYFINKDGKLSRITNLLNTTEVIDLNLNEKEHLSDFFIKEDHVYYLAGPFCDFYRGKCENTLRSFNLLTKETKELANTLPESDISGFSLDGKSIFLMSGSGDAGFGYENYTEINLLNKEIINTKYFGFDYESENKKEFDETKKEKDIFLQKISPTTKYVKYFKFTDGKIIYGEDEDIIENITKKGEAFYIIEDVRVY